MKNYILHYYVAIYLLLIPNSIVFGQEKLLGKLYYNNNWELLDEENKNHATYKRLYNYHEGSKYRPCCGKEVKDYYDGKLIWKGGVYSIGPKKDDDKRHGICIEYYRKSKQIKSKSNYDINILQWLKEYHINGKLKRHIKYKDGKKHGKIVEYDEKGNIISIGHYQDGKKHGEFILYNQKGQIQSKTRYVNGKEDKSWSEERNNNNLRKIIREYFKNNDLGWTTGIKNHDIYKNRVMSNHRLDTVEQVYILENLEKGIHQRATIPVDIPKGKKFRIKIEAKLRMYGENKNKKGEEERNWFRIILGFKDWDNFMSIDILEEENGTFNFKVVIREDGINVLRNKRYRHWEEIEQKKSYTRKVGRSITSHTHTYESPEYNTFYIERFDHTPKLKFTMNNELVAQDIPMIDDQHLGLQYGIGLYNNFAELKVHYFEISYEKD